MANRWFQQFRFSLEKYVVDLYAQVTFGATGAPTLVTANSKGIKSITRTGAGAYDVLLQDDYVRFLMADYVAEFASPAASPNMSLTSEDVNNRAAPTISIVFSTGGTPTDPASGETAYLQFSLSNSTAI